MNDKERFILFHLYRNNGESLFLHPFSSPLRLITLLEKSELVGKYGHEPRVESFTDFRNELYRMIEDGVREWVSEIRFIPKFLIASGVFLFAYVFFSFVILDPIPIFDELLLAFASSAVTYILLGRRDMKSDTVLRKRITLRNIIDRILFTESGFVKETEDGLHRTESLNNETLLDFMIRTPDKDLAENEVEEARQLVSYLERRFHSRDFRKKERLVTRLSRERSEQPPETLRRWTSSRRADVPLFALYTHMKRCIEKVEKVK